MRCIQRVADCQKSLAEFAPAGANRVSIIFSGDMRVGENTARLANVRAERVRCGEPQPFQTRAQRSGSRLRACQKYFFDTLRGSRNKTASSLFYAFQVWTVQSWYIAFFLSEKQGRNPQKWYTVKTVHFCFLLNCQEEKMAKGDVPFIFAEQSRIPLFSSVSFACPVVFSCCPKEQKCVLRKCVFNLYIRTPVAA